MKLFFKGLGDIENRFTGDSILSIREILLKYIVAIFCVFGLLAVVMGGWEVYLQGRPEIVVIYILAYLPVPYCLIFRNRLSYNFQTGIILFALYILSVFILGGVGLSGAGIVLLITFVVLTTTFWGIRKGLFAVLMSIIAILAVGSGMSTGFLPVDYVAMTNSTRIEAWLMAATLFLIIGGIMVVCPGILQNSLQSTIDIIQQKSTELEESNMRLKKALKERQQMEERLIKAEKIEAMGLLAAGVAHDLNNILTGVTTYPELMLLNMKPDDELYESMKIIKSSGDKAATIVQDLLTLSRRGVNIKTTLNLQSIVKKYIKSPEFEKLCHFHPDVRFRTQIDTDLANISGSEVHLFNVVMNLVSNAAEAIPGGGDITIKTRNLLLEQSLKGYETIPAGEYIVLEVSDTGSGISSEDLNHIFEPFFTKKKMGRSGTGLGMAIVQGAVKDHGGYIDIETSENTGTCFFIYFPATAQPVDSEPPSFNISELKGKGENILFVDDVKEQRAIGKKVLTDFRYNPVCLESGEKAIEYCRTEKPDLLIVDMIMEPGMNGYETLKALRKIHPDLKAIVISGYSETDQVRSALDLGGAIFLKKPYAVEDFAAAIHKILG